MIGSMRGKVGGYVIVGIIGFIALVFAFEGVFGPKATRGLHEGSLAGKVNGEPITISDYNKALERKTEYLKGMLGGKISDEQMKMFRIREGVFQELVQQKLMAQAALDSGRMPSDEAVREEIMKLPYFLKDGKFDPAQYRAVLEANRYTTAMFEKMIREQLAVEEWTRGFANQVRVSDAEAKEEYLSSKNQRSYKIVSIPAQMPKSDKTDLTPKTAVEKVAGMLKADKKADVPVDSLLKPFGVTVREVDDVTPGSPSIVGVADHPEMAKDLFNDSIPVGKTKVYESSTRMTAILVTAVKKPDLAKFETDKSETMNQIRSRKERELMNDVMKKLTDKASIDPNPAVVGEQTESA
ncbi:MAG: SurA N-terminal domain-containing protein [Cryobacterium sp.]|nr:SurA N-terminal domain-containing protein [Oligoflexia bacterium]